MKKSNQYSPEVRERAVRLVREYQSEYASEWAAMESIAAKIGRTAEIIRRSGFLSVRSSGSREVL